MTIYDPTLPPIGTRERANELQRRRYAAMTPEQRWEKNQKIIALGKKRYQQNPEWREKRRAYLRDLRAADPDRFRKYEAEYRQRNEAAQRAKTNRRRNRRRALAAGNDHESYTMAQVAERDEYACMICLTSIDMQLSGRDPMGPSIDHIIAIVNGGPDTLTNVQLAHMSCNSRKGSL